MCSLCMRCLLDYMRSCVALLSSETIFHFLVDAVTFPMLFPLSPKCIQAKKTAKNFVNLMIVQTAQAFCWKAVNRLK